MLESEAKSLAGEAAGSGPVRRRWFRWGRAKAAKSARKPAQMRTRIAIWAVVIGIIFGFFEVAQPLEDAYRLMRQVARPNKADGQTVIVAIDDRSLTELDTRDPLRGDDARMLDLLFEAGATKVVYDRAFADPSTLAEDRKFIAALERYRGRVHIGSIPKSQYGFDLKEQILTHPRFRDKAGMVSMLGMQGPFGFSWKLPTSSVIEGRTRPSISALLAGIDRPDSIYRPDFSIRPEDIKVLSYVDVLKGRIPASTFKSRDIIIAPANILSPDRYRMPIIGGVVLGSQIHAIGAQTLREGFPLDLGWLPALLIAAAFIAIQSRKRTFSLTWPIVTVGAIAAAPLLTDLASININIFPAVICLLVGTYRMHALSVATYRGNTGMLRIEQLHSAAHAEACDVVALKLRNFATISAILSPSEIDTLLKKLSAMLETAESVTQFAFDKDTVVWLRDRLPTEERDGHLRALHSLFRAGISIGEQAPAIAIAIGLDANYGWTLRERIESAIQGAEDAAYHGKLFSVSDGEREDDRSWRLQFFAELSGAMERGDVKVLFQPKVNLATGAIVGAEALLRWNHPTRGPIDPAEIVAFAEEHNRIDTITRFVLDRAMRDAKLAIERDPSFKVAVNVSALDLRDPGFASDIADRLAANRFPAGNLILEITETAPIENDKVAGAILLALKQIGVRLSVDDFGTGHASLHYLRQIPSHEVKIDRSFVSGMMESREDATLVKTAIEMIHSLGRIAVAEGVESAEVAEALRALACDKAQGYYFSKAMPIQQLIPKLPKGSLAA